MYKYRGRHTQIVFGEPLPARPLPPKPVAKNIIAEALKIREFLAEDPQKTYRHASQRFKISRARISQLLKIVNVMPNDFVEYMGDCKDQALIRQFSGKTLLLIVGLKSPAMRQQAIDTLWKESRY